MSLLELWKDTPEQLRDKRIDQVIGFAGDGRLGDKNTAPAEFRGFLKGIPSDMIRRYAEECLTVGFKDSGLALQDIVNEIGGRLLSEMVPGRYRGIQGAIGYDGLWKGPDGHGIVVEVKTTDAYRIDLATVATYRQKLIASGEIDEQSSSILIVVGRQDTGDLEAQIRGSRHAWDIRLISVDSLLRLLSIKEGVEDPGTERRIREILVPREYTRVDEIIELAFSTTQDLQEKDLPQDEDIEEDEDIPSGTRKKMAFNDECAQRIGDHLGIGLVKQSRVTYRSPEGDTRLLCAVSRAYGRPDNPRYWFAIHMHQREFLDAASTAYVGLGCGSPDNIVLFPFSDFALFLERMQQTLSQGHSFRHIRMYRNDNEWTLHFRKDERQVITQYVLPKIT